MKKLLTPAILAIALSFSASNLGNIAYASNTKTFASTISAPASTVKINVVIGENLAYRAENLSKDLSDRTQRSSISNGFSGNGFFGQRDLDQLASRLERKMAQRLAKNGIAISDDAADVLTLTITDAKPSRPTFKQLSKSPSLSFSSFALGGASFEGTMTKEGQEAGVLSYAWYENDIRNPGAGASTWFDANQAIDRFARKTAKSLK